MEESLAALDACRPALRRVFLTHCPLGPVLALSELLQFCANVHVFPVPATQELASALVIRQLAAKVARRSDDIRLTYAQFEQLLRLLAMQCFSEGNEHTRLKCLLAHIKAGVQDYYGVSLYGGHKDSSSSSVDAQPRLSDGAPQTRSSARFKTVSKLTKKLSLTNIGFSKMLSLQQIYQPITQLRRRPSAIPTSPKSITSRVIPQTPSDRMHARHTSMSTDLVSKIRDAVRRFEGKFRERGVRREVPRRVVSFLKRRNKRRVKDVRAT